MIIRPVALTDLPALQAIAAESGPGFTSLVNDRSFLTRKIERSITSFAAPVNHPGDQGYLFVLEDTAAGDILGTTGIEATVGNRHPLYHYRLGQSREQQTLSLCTHYTGCSEICTLYLRPEFRRPWAGKLLSRVRFAFMAQHPERFAETVIAEMRGVSDDAGRSPFWRWLQAHFVNLDFATVTQRVGSGDNGFIADLMPEHPLYTRLMDDEARAVIGQVHPKTRPALRMLEAEGFRFTGQVDPFDAGPTVEARVSELRSLNQTRRCRVHIRPEQAPIRDAWTNGGQGKTLMVTNTETAAFRATVTDAARYLPAHRMLEVPASLARALGLANGAEACFFEMDAQASRLSVATETTATPSFREVHRAH